MNKNVVVPFPSQHPDHEDDTKSQPSPDPQELQRVFGQLVEALSPHTRPANERDIRIRNFRSSRLELIDDLIVVLEEHADHYVANSYDTGQYGYGPSPDDAIMHLCSVLEDYYDLLLEDEGHLSPRLESHLRYLRFILKER
jgi:hypothetical protein